MGINVKDPSFTHHFPIDTPGLELSGEKNRYAYQLEHREGSVTSKSNKP